MNDMRNLLILLMAGIAVGTVVGCKEKKQRPHNSTESSGKSSFCTCQDAGLCADKGSGVARCVI